MMTPKPWHRASLARPRPADQEVNDIATKLAARVRQLRVQSGQTQAKLAARAGVTVETVARLERVVRGRSSANSNPSLETLAGLAEALGVEVAELLAAPSTGRRPRDDRVGNLLRGASTATRRRVECAVEALVREDRQTARPSRKKREG
jgi:transcriptional regulator with XRE-family HTH domain